MGLSCGSQSYPGMQDLRVLAKETVDWAHMLAAQAMGSAILTNYLSFLLPNLSTYKTRRAVLSLSWSF